MVVTLAQKHDKRNVPSREILSRIKVLLAGRATEEIIFGEDNGLFSLEINNALDEKHNLWLRRKKKI